MEKENLTQIIENAFIEYKAEVMRGLRNAVKPLNELMAYYDCAMMEVETKFKVLNQELSLDYDRNPIEHIKTRLKSINSIGDKLYRQGLDINVSNIEKHLSDVAGIRIICSYQSDIYALAEAFLRQDDVTLIKKKDYIAHPKPNGYRSLHLIVGVPIYLHSEKKIMKVEIQFRTISMDCWASLEHKIRYKKGLEIPKEVEEELLECANIAAELDNRMQQARSKVDSLVEANK